MKIRKDKLELWNKGVKNNQDPYGSAVYRYLERWADLMEKEIENSSESPEEVIIQNAERLSHKADTEGITGFMYGAAVSILSQGWEYGEILRKWHNKKYGYEGEGVANPAIMTIRRR